MSSTFKLIAVKIGQGCAEHIRKNLKEEVWYLFDKDYTIDEELDSPKLKKDRQVPDNFFSTEEGQNPSPTINIHAIVGMNGSGKSALIDFILRLINSYACKLVGYKGRKEHDPQVIYKGGNDYNKNKPEDLAWIYGVIGKICLDYDGKIYVYTINTSKNNPNIEYITIETIENGKVCPNSGASEPTFYTILLNYSIHSLNTADYSEEQTEGYHWLNGLFHKNDGYKTPCVLTPQRLKGNIDINTENELSKDRLIAIALMNKEGNIGGGYKLGNLSIRFDALKTRDKLDTLRKNTSDLLESRPPSPENIEEGKEELHKLCKEALNLPIGEIKTKTERILNKYFLTCVSPEDLMNILNSDLSNDEFCKRIEELITNTDFEKDKARPSFDDLLKKVQLTWGKKIEEDKSRFSEQCLFYKSTHLKEKCLEYLAYKTMSIDHRYIYKYPILLNQKESIFYYSGYPREEKINNLIDLIYEDRSHITNKIHQTLEFLKLNENDWDGKIKDIETKSIEHKKETNDWRKDKEAHNPYPNVPTFTIQTKDLRCSAQNDIKEIYLVPPPIFDVELLVSKDKKLASKNEEEKEEIPLSKLSSGEKQLLYSSSSYLYHLLNLDSVHESLSDRIKYDYVNLICDEIELYFHPEYQRQFVDYMLKSIRSMNLKHIKAINILLSTHSPFILSDIPDAHVLYLKEGKPVNRQGETFGANIHELLRDAFFLNGMPIGDFAREKILKLNERIKSADEHSQFEQLEKEITLIGEPILRRQLGRLLGEKVMTMGSIRLATKTELLENRVRTLESEIRRLKKKRENYD